VFRLGSRLRRELNRARILDDLASARRSRLSRIQSSGSEVVAFASLGLDRNTSGPSVDSEWNRPTRDHEIIATDQAAR
jgi:hypothetical protein